MIRVDAAVTAGSQEVSLHLVPKVRRARGYRLYTEGGGRLIDLWQAGGAAALGHNPPGLLRELKNAAERGLFAPLPAYAGARFFKALAALFPGRDFRVYAAGRDPGRVLGIPSPADPAIGESDPRVSLWRPFLGEAETALGTVPALIPVLPGPAVRGQGPWVLAADPDFTRDHPLPGSDLLSPVLLVAAARCVWDLIAALPERGLLPFPRILKVLPGSAWRRRGIYLYPRESPDEKTWAALFRRFLERGFLIPPGCREPLILPGVLSGGEDAKLAELLEEPLNHR